MYNATEIWLQAIKDVTQQGKSAKPRDKTVTEILNYSFEMDMKWPIVGVPTRKLSYKFMAAEAMWILSGDNSTRGIVPYNNHIAKFSDNGTSFFGAYGPPISEQWDHIINTLSDDADSRQAVITIWRQRPQKSKDIPCTVSLQWMIRDGKLHCFANMRSSDLWLGLPYDIFNFTMITAKIAHHLQYKVPGLDLGLLYWNGASTHIYNSNIEDVHRVLFADRVECTSKLSKEVWKDFNGILWPSLVYCRELEPNPKWRIRPCRK